MPFVFLAATAVASLMLLAITGTYRTSFRGLMADKWFAIGVGGAGSGAQPVRVVNIVMLVCDVSGASTGGIHRYRVLWNACEASSRAPITSFAVVGVPQRTDLALTHEPPLRDKALLRMPVADIEGAFAGDHSTPPRLQAALTEGATRVFVPEALRPDRLLTWWKSGLTRRN